MHKHYIKYNNAFIWLIFVFIFITSCTKEVYNNFSVKGKFENITSKDIYIVKELSKDSLTIDTIRVNSNGEFEFQGKVSTTTSISLFYNNSLPPLHFYIDEGYSVHIKENNTHPTSFEIRGGEINDNLNDFRKKNANILLAKERALSKKEHIDPAELKNINFQLGRSVRDYVEKNPTKIASVVLMNEYSIGNVSVDLLDQDIKLLNGKALDFYQTTALKDYVDRVRASRVGASAPEISLTSTKGKTFKLSEQKGKNTLLIFDLKDSPANESYFQGLKNAYVKLKKDIDFVAIVIDEDPTKPDAKVLEIANSLDWTVLLDSQKWNSKEVKKYNITTAPYMILISPEGKILERDVILDSLINKFNSNNN